MYGLRPRLEIFSMSLNDKDFDKYSMVKQAVRSIHRFANEIDLFQFLKDNSIKFKDPFSIFITDGQRVLEMFNSVKKNQYDQSWYCTLPDGVQKKTNPPNIQKRKNPIQKKKNRKGRSSRGYSSVPGSSKKEKELKNSDSINISEMRLMGPNGDISPLDKFRVIVHQNTGDAEVDASQLLADTPSYLRGIPLNPSDVICSWRAVRYSEYDSPFIFKVYGPFGSLTLDCIAYKFSRTVTVRAILLLDDNRQCHYLEDGYCATHSICGNIYFQNTKFTKKKSVLFNTPKGKALHVWHGMSIPLWRNTVAVPYGSKFKVGATFHIKTPVDFVVNGPPVEIGATFHKHFVVNGPPVVFKFDDFCKANNFKTYKVITGRGFRISVKVSMNNLPLSF